MTARKLCALADLPEGAARVFDVDGVELAAARSGAKVFVVENRCSHDDGPLGEGRLVGGEIECPRHGARFDLASGRATRMPAVAPIATYTARIEGEDVLVEIDS
jgi:3-phenylpropionate/trans-cinnamate dioxygenase ferredoxin subunit